MSQETQAVKIVDAQEVVSTPMESFHRSPSQILSEAKIAADALKNIIKQKEKKVMFNGEQYLELEDWQTVGRFYGFTAKIISTNFVNFDGIKGFEAVAVALDQDGIERTRAESMCLSDEDKWRSRPKYEYLYVTKSGGLSADDPGKDEIIWTEFKGKKAPKKIRKLVGEEAVPLFQLKSMAQTRACSRALRQVLAWVVVLAGFKTTPAEEMDGVKEDPKSEEPKEQNQNENQQMKTPPHSATISEAQAKRLYAIAKESGFSNEQMKSFILEEYKYNSSRDILKKDYQAICDRVQRAAGIPQEDRNA